MDTITNPILTQVMNDRDLQFNVQQGMRDRLGLPPSARIISKGVSLEIQTETVEEWGAIVEDDDRRMALERQVGAMGMGYRAIVLTIAGDPVPRTRIPCDTPDLGRQKGNR